MRAVSVLAIVAALAAGCSTVYQDCDDDYWARRPSWAASTLEWTTTPHVSADAGCVEESDCPVSLHHCVQGQCRAYCSLLNLRCEGALVGGTCERLVIVRHQLDEPDSLGLAYYGYGDRDQCPVGELCVRALDSALYAKWQRDVSSLSAYSASDGGSQPNDPERPETYAIDLRMECFYGQLEGPGHHLIVRQDDLRTERLGGVCVAVGWLHNQ